MKTHGTVYWREIKRKLRRKYPVLTEKDLGYYEGKEKEMMENLGYKLKKTKVELLDIIVNL